MLREQGAGQAHGAQDARAEADTETAKLGAQERVVEARVMSDKQSSFEAIQQLGADVRERWSARQHVLGDASQRNDEGRHGAPRVDQCRPFLHQFAVDHLDQSDLGDAIPVGARAGRLQVEE